MPSIDFCNRMDPRAHLTNLPNPGVVMPKQFAPVKVRIEQHCRTGVPSPWRSPVSRAFMKSGVARRSHAEPTPAQQPLAARIYPNSIDSDTSCRDADTRAA
jgi:hypothetical protein